VAGRLVFEPQEVRLPGGRQVLVRSAYPNDAPSLLLGLEMIAQEGLIGAEPGERTLNQARDLIHASDGRRGLLLVAVDGARVVGACGLNPQPLLKAAHVLELGMFLLPAWRGSGLARELVERALAWAADSGFRKVVLGVFAGNERALAFYRKMGFQREGVRRGQYEVNGRLEDEVLMARFLD
jgi:RimJ/RimL family protein N-acetyltransferase